VPSQFKTRVLRAWILQSEEQRRQWLAEHKINLAVESVTKRFHELTAIEQGLTVIDIEIVGRTTEDGKLRQ